MEGLLSTEPTLSIFFMINVYLIVIVREILCLPYAGFFWRLSHLFLFSHLLTSVMNRSPMDKELLCILCKDVVYLKESEYTEHMILVHNTNTHLNILLSINFMNNITKNSIVSKVKLTIKPHQGDQYYSCIFCTNNNQESQISLSKIFEFRTHLETCHAIFYQQDLMLAMQFIDGINNMEELSVFLQNPIIKTKSLNIFDLEKNKTHLDTSQFYRHHPYWLFGISTFLAPKEKDGTCVSSRHSQKCVTLLKLMTELIFFFFFSWTPIFWPFFLKNFKLTSYLNR